MLFDLHNSINLSILTSWFVDAMAPPLVIPALRKHTATVIWAHGLGDRYHIGTLTNIDDSSADVAQRGRLDADS